MPHPIWSGFHPIIADFIAENVDNKNPKDVDGWTPLHWAARSGRLLVCQLIIETLDEKNPKTQTGWTPFHWACKNGHFQKVWSVFCFENFPYVYSIVCSIFFHVL